MARKVDEFRTSKTCSNCLTVFVDKRYRTKQCRNEMCRKLWHRDVNAAVNIRLAFMHMCLNEGERPEAFTRATLTTGRTGGTGCTTGFGARGSGEPAHAPNEE